MRAKPSAGQNKGVHRTKTLSTSEIGDQSTLSLERIVDAAVALLDANGINGLTMRKLADRLNAGTMSLYWHVANKDEVFDLALDAVLLYRTIPCTDGHRDWRMDIVHMLEDWRACMLRHPWSISVLPSRALGPSILGRLEWLSQILSDAGLADRDLNVAIWSFWNHVMGATVTKGNFDRTQNDKEAEKRPPADIAEHYPSIARTRLLSDDDWDGAFTTGINFLIDGLVLKR